MGDKYPGPKARHWEVQVEFLDGTVIDAMSDEDALERWRRIAAWTDPTSESDPVGWMNRVLDRARVFYQVPLVGITGHAPAAVILDALADGNCLELRRK